MTGNCMNVVLDTNVLVMSLSLRNQYSYIWESFVNGNYTLCLTNDIMEEYEEVISRNISPYSNVISLNITQCPFFGSALQFWSNQSRYR